MTAWKTIDASQILPRELSAAVTTMAKLLAEGLDSLEASTSIGQGIPDLPTIPDPVTTVATAVLDTLEGLLKGGRIHVLAVPIAKAPPTPTLSLIHI